MAEGGYDTASYINSVYSAADSKYGAADYWIRYFTPSPNGTVDQSSSHANSECDADWDSGAKHLSPITSPAQSHLSGSSAQGLADAQAFAAAIHNVWAWVLPLFLPTNNTLYSWLDQEAGTSMSSNYWSGWAGYINSYQWGNAYPLFACLYCNPCGGAGHNCTTVVAAGGCFRIWSSEPETPYCGYKLSNLPPWAAHTCSCVTSGPPTILWQFAEQPVCNLTVNVDMDEGTMTPYTFYLGSRP